MLSATAPFSACFMLPVATVVVVTVSATTARCMRRADTTVVTVGVVKQTAHCIFLAATTVVVVIVSATAPVTAARVPSSASGADARGNDPSMRRYPSCGGLKVTPS